MENEVAKQADIAALRDRLFEGLTPFNDFAAALGLHPKTVKKKDPPSSSTSAATRMCRMNWGANGCLTAADRLNVVGPPRWRAEIPPGSRR